MPNSTCPLTVHLPAVLERGDEEAIASLVAHNPQGRLIQPREVANAVTWLCGDNAASVTGQSIVIAGGEIMP